MPKRKARSRNNSQARNLSTTDISVENDTQIAYNSDGINTPNLTLVSDPMLTNTNIIEQAINISNDPNTNLAINPTLQINSQTNSQNDCPVNVPNNTTNPENDPNIVSNITSNSITNSANVQTKDNHMLGNKGKHEFKSIITVGSVTPQNFDGNGDIDDWIDHFTYIAKCNNWSNDMKKLRLPVHLKGMAEMWYRNFAKLKTDATYENKLSLDDIYDGLKSAFRPKNYRSIQQSKLITRHQQLNESVSNYHYDIIRLCEKLNPLMDEQEKLTHVMRGLRSGMLEKVLVFEPKDCIDLLGKLKSIEESEVLSQQRPTYNYLLMNSTKTNELSQSEPISETRFGTRTEPKNSESQNGSPQSQSDISKLCSMFEEFMNKNQYRNKDNRYNNRFQYRRTVDGRPVCDYCHKPGHFARSCYRRQNNTLSKSPSNAILPAPECASADQGN